MKNKVAHYKQLKGCVLSLALCATRFERSLTSRSVRRGIKLVDSVPKSPSGKLLRRSESRATLSRSHSPSLTLLLARSQSCARRPRPRSRRRRRRRAGSARRSEGCARGPSIVQTRTATMQGTRLGTTGERERELNDESEAEGARGEGRRRRLELHRVRLLGCERASRVSAVPRRKAARLEDRCEAEQRREREKDERRTLDFPRPLLRDALGMPLKQLDVRLEARLAPVGLQVAPARELLELEEELADGRDRVGVERVDLRGEERDTDLTCERRARESVPCSEGCGC